MDKKSSVVVTASLLFLLSACSGGGGGGSDSDTTTPPVTLSVSGKAAAGAAIIGSVTIRDSSSPYEEKLATISTDGSYTFDVSDMTAPFMMRADGTVGGTYYEIYSAATSADINGTVNITPLTDLIVANIAGQLAETYFNAGSFSGMTTTELNAAETALQTRLQPVLTAIGLADTIDLLRTSFNPDHTGLDAALDILRVTTDTTTAIATITNVIDNVAITDNLASQADASVITATSVATGLTDFQQIAAKFDALTGYFATSLPNPSNTGLNALFDGTNFLWSGDNLASTLTFLTTNSNLIGAQFTDVTLDVISSTTATVGFTIKFSGKTQRFNWQMNKSGSDWLMAGDQRIGFVSVNPFASYDATSTALQTGLWLEAGPFIVTPVNYAVITGNGLPTTGGGANGASAGVLLFEAISGDDFRVAASGVVYNGASTTQAACGSNCNTNWYSLNDTAIGTIKDGDTYTTTLYNDSGTVGDLSDDTIVATYTDQPTKKPYLSTELSAASFPTDTSNTTAVTAAVMAGGSITLTWTLPTGITANNVDFYRSYTDTSIDSVETEVAATATSVTFTLPAPDLMKTVYGGGGSLSAKDQFDRDIIAIR